MRLFPTSVILLLAWGALAVGGSPSWAAAPVAVFAATTGILGFLERRESAPTLPHRPVILALCLFLAAIGVQLVPLPESIVTRLSPAHDVAAFERLLATADRRDPELVPTVAAGASRPLSIAPARTWWGLGFAAAFALFTLGAARGLSAVSLPRVSRGILLLGAVVAFMGLYQRTRDSFDLYGLYAPLAPSRLSAPFMNHNHQAGWLVMVSSLAIGLFVGEVARGMRTVASAWRARILWFSTKQANVALLLLFTIALMAIAILATQSRSGAATFSLALVAMRWWGGRRQASKLQRRAVTGGLIAVILLAVAISGSDVAARIAGTSWYTMDGRVAVWNDTLPVLSHFWLTGTGFNTYGTAMLHYQTAADGAQYVEAHNDYLQLAAEGGLLVGIPTLILISSLVVEIRRRFNERADDTRTYWVRVGAVTGLVGIAAQSLVEFTLQMPGAAAMFATLLAIAIHHPRPRMASPERHAE
ncbi:MAG: O-antigen ligase family protein [Vicinamibacterales bacterium]